MDKEERENSFKAQLVSVLKDLNKNGVKDKQAMMLIGNLAGQFIDLAGMKNWTDLKAITTKDQFKNMLSAMQSEGKKLQDAGNIKAAYAVQAVAVSLVSNTMKDPDTLKGRDLLDDLINQAYYLSKRENLSKQN